MSARFRGGKEGVGVCGRVSAAVARKARWVCVCLYEWVGGCVGRGEACKERNKTRALVRLAGVPYGCLTCFPLPRLLLFRSGFLISPLVVALLLFGYAMLLLFCLRTWLLALGSTWTWSFPPRAFWKGCVSAWPLCFPVLPENLGFRFEYIEMGHTPPSRPPSLPPSLPPVP